MKECHDYDDIIQLERPRSKRHGKMPIMDRAAQFAPFAALTGHAAAIAETHRYVEWKRELSEDEKGYLDQQFQMLMKEPANTTVHVVYFEPDPKKNGGYYKEKQGSIKKIDWNRKRIVFTDDQIIPVNDIYDLNKL